MKRKWNWLKNEEESSRAVPSRNKNSRQSLTSANYFGPMGQLYQDMERLFDQTMQNFGMPAMFGNMNSLQNMMFLPEIDIAESDREYTITMDVPGIDERDLRIDVTRDGQLCISGEKRMESGGNEKNFHRMERSYGSFQRVLALPDDCDQEHIEADFKNGVLTITGPRTESAGSQSRRISIGGEGGQGSEGGRGPGRPPRVDHGQDNLPPGAQNKRTA